jgi:hypothetical protein
MPDSDFGGKDAEGSIGPESSREGRSDSTYRRHAFGRTCAAPAFPFPPSPGRLPEAAPGATGLRMCSGCTGFQPYLLRDSGIGRKAKLAFDAPWLCDLSYRKPIQETLGYATRQVSYLILFPFPSPSWRLIRFTAGRKITLAFSFSFLFSASYKGSCLYKKKHSKCN